MGGMNLSLPLPTILGYIPICLIIFYMSYVDNINHLFLQMIQLSLCDGWMDLSQSLTKSCEIRCEYWHWYKITGQNDKNQSLWKV